MLFEFNHHSGGDRLSVKCSNLPRGICTLIWKQYGLKSQALVTSCSALFSDRWPETCLVVAPGIFEKSSLVRIRSSVEQIGIFPLTLSLSTRWLIKIIYWDFRVTSPLQQIFISSRDYASNMQNVSLGNQPWERQGLRTMCPRTQMVRWCAHYLEVGYGLDLGHGWMRLVVWDRYTDRG